MISLGAWGRGALSGVLAAMALSHISLAVAGEVVTSAAPVDVPAAPGWKLRLPPDAPVIYRGVVSFDEAGMGAAGMLYPAPGVAGLLAAIITHGVIVDAAKQKQKDQLQEAADQILVPYKPILDKFVYRDLLQRAIGKTKLGGKGRLIDAGVNAGQVTLVESLPVFRLTQDQKAIILDSAVAIQLPGVSSEAAYRASIRIVSSPSNSLDLAAFWSASDGERIKDESSRLVAESFDIAFAEATKVAGAASVPYRTVRYLEGAVERIERAQVLAEQCERLLIRSLRGNLMSVPVARSTLPDARCKAEVSRDG